MDELRNWSYIFRPSETRTHNWSHVSRPLASERGIYGMDKLRNCTLFASLGPRLRREEFKEWMNSETGHMSLGPWLRREELRHRDI